MSTEKFTLDGEYIEVNLLLKLVGVCDSGGAGKMLVANGEVSVDGVAETRKTAKIRAGQKVTCGDTEILVVADPKGGVDGRVR
ncbi:RNA-binding S4 domain-containing protein [Stenotrophobium rhamnosiphilum]|uniref:RNA-binding protein n=1 Tax=Stenotrophobium rhamnosiphilum TaxID=2029166 RepID=A0A2T5MCF2_9GAMM|nr:RNA-binding S4 domain-containing protein [Stenotrophobium rhamnosiphilum]PTU30241.1 RNA-binding protein [Stenotrophobium rhamnosiphilum]